MIFVDLVGIPRTDFHLSDVDQNKNVTFNVYISAKTKITSQGLFPYSILGNNSRLFLPHGQARQGG